MLDNSKIPPGIFLNKQEADMLEEFTADLLARHEEGLASAVEREVAEAYLAAEQEAQEAHQQFVNNVLAELERREAGTIWLPPLPLDELSVALELSRALRGRPLTATRFEAPGMLCGLECVSGTIYLVYETSDETAWGRFLLCSIWGTRPLQEVTEVTSSRQQATALQAQGESPQVTTSSDGVPFCFTEGDATDGGGTEDGIHWVRLALLDKPNRPQEVPLLYGCRIVLPLMTAPDEDALLMLSQPIAFEMDFIPQFPDGQVWFDASVEKTFLTTRGGDARNSRPAATRSITNQTGKKEEASLRIDLHTDPDGQIEVEARCLALDAVGIQTTLHVATGTKDNMLWQTSHIFTAVGETIRRPVPLPHSLQSPNSDSQIYLSVSVPDEPDVYPATE